MQDETKHNVLSPVKTERWMAKAQMSAKDQTSEAFLFAARRGRQEDKVQLSKQGRQQKATKKRLEYDQKTSSLVSSNPFKQTAGGDNDMKDDGNGKNKEGKNKGKGKGKGKIGDDDSHHQHRPEVQVVIEKLPAIVKMLHPNERLDDRLKALKTIGELMLLDVKRPIAELHKAGGIPAIVQCLKESKSLDLQHAAASAIINISGDVYDDNNSVLEMLQSGAYEAVVDWIKSHPSQPEVAMQGVFILGNFAGEDDTVRHQLVKNGVAEVLGMVANHFFLSVKQPPPTEVGERLDVLAQETAFAYKNILEKEPGIPRQLLEPAIKLLVNKCLFMRDIGVLFDTLTALNFIARRSDLNARRAANSQGEAEEEDCLAHRVSMESGAGAKRMVELTLHKHSTIKEAAIRLVATLVSSELNEGPDLLIHNSLLPCLIQLSNDPSKEVRREVWFCVSNLLLGTPEQYRAVLSTDLLVRAVQIPGNANLDMSVQREALYVVYEAVLNCDDVVLLAKNLLYDIKVCQPLCKMLHVMTDNKIVRRAAIGLSKALQMARKFDRATSKKQRSAAGLAQPLLSCIKEQIEEEGGKDMLSSLIYTSEDKQTAFFCEAAIKFWDDDLDLDEPGDGMADDDKKSSTNGTNGGNNFGLLFNNNGNMNGTGGGGDGPQKLFDSSGGMTSASGSLWTNNKQPPSKEGHQETFPGLSVDQNHQGGDHGNAMDDDTPSGLGFPSHIRQQQQQQQQQPEGSPSFEFEADRAL